MTEEIFSKVFDESDFHRQNNVAKELYTLEAKFFTGKVKKSTLRGLEPYYAAIRATAALIFTHSEKQAFLKVISEFLQSLQSEGGGSPRRHLYSKRGRAELIHLSISHPARGGWSP